MPKTLAYLLRKGVQDMSLTLREKQAVTRELSIRYMRSSKKEKSQLIVQLMEITGYTRSYATRVLRKPPKPERPLRPRGKRGFVYGPKVIGALRRVWLILDCISGKRLSPFLPEIVPILERHGELCLDDDTRQKLLSMSAATIDRRLAEDRRRLDIKGRSGTKPGSLLKRNIPIKTFSDWSDTVPGFVEVDLVGHDGGNVRGEYAQTLDVVDVATRWTETRAVKNKAQKWVFQALKHIIARFPFPILGIDSDNGSEFINAHLIRFCAENKITFTRSRAYKKNDSCYVEQKNWSVVRRTVGYARYTTDEQVSLLNEIYEILRLYTNYFQPVMVLREKERKGSRVTKRYEKAKTPYQRVMDSAHIPQEIKDRLTTEYETLNPACLKRRLLALIRLLMRSCLPNIGAKSKPEKHQPSGEGGVPHAANYTT